MLRVWKMFLCYLGSNVEGWVEHELLDLSILQKANLRDSLQMAYLLQLYRQENSLKCRLRNKLVTDDIHITITEGRGCEAEGRGKKKKKK